MCHNPNQSSSGREIDPATVMSELPPEAIAIIGTNPLVYPEDAQNFKDLVHGIHSAGFRTRDYEHVRGPTREGYYNWHEVKFPRGAETSKCTLCHDESPELPLVANLLPTTVRTTMTANGQDPDRATVQSAFANVPNANDWVNLPTSSSCFYCHTSTDAWAHMAQNGGLTSIPPSAGPWSNRMNITGSVETCAVCHGPGRIADIDVVHSK
jgi:OmcA/MtrC family decaheme c-type cytochrome